MVIMQARKDRFVSMADIAYVKIGADKEVGIRDPDFAEADLTSSSFTATLAGGDGLRAAVGAAVLFAALHLPNPLLTCLSLFAAVGWREWYRRHPNLPAVWASHFALSFAVMATQDSEWLRRMRVGAAYLYFRG